MRFDEETRHLERLEKIITEKPHSAFLTKTGEKHIDKLQNAINFFREKSDKLQEKIDEVKALCNENTIAREVNGGIQYVIPVYKIMDVLECKEVLTEEEYISKYYPEKEGK